MKVRENHSSGMCSPTSAHGYSDLVGVRTRIMYKLIYGPPADSSWSTVCYCTWQSTMHRTMLSCQVSHISLAKSIRDHSNIYNPRLERHNQGLSIIDFFAILCLWLLEEPSLATRTSSVTLITITEESWLVMPRINCLVHAAVVIIPNAVERRITSITSSAGKVLARE